MLIVGKYAYSAWAPQFAEKMRLSSTNSNLIVSRAPLRSDLTKRLNPQGIFGNLGMYASGIPLGLLVDSKGPRPGVLLGSIAIGTGYFAMYKGMTSQEI